jgi:hypothetical protein
MATPEHRLDPRQFIARALRVGITPTAALRAFRASGGRIRTQTWFQVAGEVRAALAVQPQAQAASFRRRPLADEISRMTSRRARGFEYRFRLGGRLTETGEQVVVFHSVRSPELLRISEAAAIAVSTAADVQARYVRPLEVEDIVLDSVLEYSPGLEE